MSVTHVDIIYDQKALRILGDDQFVSLWNTLLDKCPYATGFQTPGFVQAWFGAYGAKWKPLIIQSQDLKGDLLGLWLLAHDPVANVIAHAGTNQAEYHTWLAVPGEDVSFLSVAWAELKRSFNFASLCFKYLSSNKLGEILQTVSGISKGLVLRIHSRPLLILNPEDVKASFAKKSNKSRFSRLKKLGNLDFRRITEYDELDRVFGDLIDYYDFRQSAVNHSAPFREDPQKRRFYSNLFTAIPGLMYVTVSYLDKRPIAAFWGMVSGKMVHLGMLMYSPILGKHSPGKLHIMQLCKQLLKEDKDVMDLTPGGDPWKERFANAHDEVAEAIVYRSAWARIRDVMQDRLLVWGKRCSTQLGITPAKVRATLAMLHRVRLPAVIQKIRNWYVIKCEMRVYRGDRTFAKRYHCDERVRCNSLYDLLSFEPGESWQTRDNFLSSALTRLEQGEFAYSVSIQNNLAHYGWMVVNQRESYMTEVKQSMTFPPGSVTLYDFYSPPDFRGRGLYRATIGHMLHEAFSNEETHYAYISVLSDNLPSRHVIETMGFEYQGSFFWERRFSAEKKWAGPMHAQSETDYA